MFDWFAGNGLYKTLGHCMGHDTFWMALLVVSCVNITTAYFCIAHAALSEASEARRSGRAALFLDFMWVFFICGLCGYAFYPIKIWWPGYRLLVVVQVILGFVTWRFYFRAKKEKFFADLFRYFDDK